MLNYNGCEVTLESLASLLRSDYPGLDVLVIDNGSTDDSFEVIRERHPEIGQIRVAENQGISWGLNHGIRWALDQGYDYLLLMNNDIEVAEDMVSRLVEAAEADPRIGCVGPKSYYHSDRERLWSTGGILRFRESVTRERGDGEIDRGQYDRDEEVPYINGCAMLARREAFEQVGLWDPVYYLGVEDADWCVRMKQAGFRCHYAHRAHLWHMISHSIGVYKPTAHLSYRAQQCDLPAQARNAGPAAYGAVVVDGGVAGCVCARAAEGQPQGGAVQVAWFPGGFTDRAARDSGATPRCASVWRYST